MLRERDGTLRRCPDSWLDLGHRQLQWLRADLNALIQLRPEHVVVSHGPPVVDDGPAAFELAVTREPPA
jgi:hypothetical protein